MDQRQRKLLSLVALSATICIATASASHAQSVSLGFSSLPSSQGWTYEGNVAESSVFSVGGGALSQATVGKGLATDADYIMNGIVNTSQSFEVNLQAKVTADEPNELRDYGFGFEVQSPTDFFAISIENGLVRDYNGNGVSVDTSVFHSYRLDGSFVTGKYSLWIDGSLATTGGFTVGAAANDVVFGDLTPTGGNANAQITQFSFSNTTAAEPDALFLGLLGAVSGVLGFSHRYFRRQK